jgi:hypothetical protein
VFNLLKKITTTIKKLSPNPKLLDRSKNAADKAKRTSKTTTKSAKGMPEVDSPKKTEKVDKTTKKGYGTDKNDGPKTTKSGTSKVEKDNKPEENICGTSDETACKALDEYNSASIKENREYGGLIYKDSSGQYGHTKGTRGSIDGVSPWDGDPIPDGTEEVGYWHTHGNYSKMEGGKLVPTDNKSADWYDSDNFSPQDIDVANEIGKNKTEYRGYVGTPSGDFKGYDAKTGKQYTIKKN